LKHLITLRWGMTLAGAHLLTAQGLSRKIVFTAGGDPPPGQADDLVLDDLIRDIVRNEKFPADWKALVRTTGGAGALHRSLRDLEEARVPARKKNRAPVLRLHALFQEGRKRLGLGTTSDPVEAAIQVSGDSGFLQSLGCVLYYGFYDMTQLQMDLLEAVSSHCPTTVFLPCAPGRRAFEFAEGFLGALEARVAGADARPAANAGEGEAARKSPPAGEGDPPLLRPALDRLFSEEAAGQPPHIEEGALRSFTATGPSGELEIAAKEILRWIEEEGAAFDGIGVIARSLDAYLPHLPTVFDTHAVPFRTPEKRPVSRSPWAMTLLALNRVLAEGCSKADVLDVLASPYFQAGGGGVSVGETARRWVRRFGVIRGVEDWRKLARADLSRPADPEKQTDVGPDSPPAGVEEAGRFQRGLGRLLDAAAKFPRRGSWGIMIDNYRQLIEDVLGGSMFEQEDQDRPEGIPGESPLPSPPSPGDSLTAIFAALADRAKIRPETDAGSFLVRVGEHLRAHEVPPRDPAHAAVEVLNAMDARGKQFDRIVVMGLQEGVWPRTENEDPFLNNNIRRRLSDSFSVHLPQKSAGGAEERLLFTLALASGRRRVTLTRQRSGEDGRPLVRSWYLHELARALGRTDGNLPGTAPVPRGLEERMNQGIFSDSLWTPSEWTARLLIHGHSPEALHSIRGLEAGILEGCFDAGSRLSRLGSGLTDRDGMIDKLPERWNDLKEKGFSPTALETYARCPFRFFAKHVLRLEELDDFEEIADLESRDIGDLLHEIFERFFSSRTHDAPDDASAPLSRAIETTLNGYEKKAPVGHPFLWQRTRRTLRALAEGYIGRGLEFLRESGFQPVAYEKRSDITLPDDPSFPSILRRMKIHGRLDRIDRRESEAGVELRVVDYKYTAGKAVAKRNLEQETVRGRRLQPAFYALLARADEPDAKVSAELHYVAPNWPENASRQYALPSDAWESGWAMEMGKTLSEILTGIRDGQFYIIPQDGEGSHCRTCPYQVLCRRNHRPTRYRRTADPQTRRIENLPEKKWPPPT
ncbi:MAG: PD-(D/E)XK nuclease family protein, partial [Nitrospinota bacterium]|nr:PD-(D/E)XK nuclease family protein [Nitrospinota bacterium]